MDLRLEQRSVQPPNGIFNQPEYAARRSKFKLLR
jgi:hypothetical protein